MIGWFTFIYDRLSLGADSALNRIRRFSKFIIVSLDSLISQLSCYFNIELILRKLIPIEK